MFRRQLFSRTTMVDVIPYVALTLFEEIDKEKEFVNHHSNTEDSLCKDQCNKQLPGKINKCSKCENHAKSSESLPLDSKYKGCISYGENPRKNVRLQDAVHACNHNSGSRVKKKGNGKGNMARLPGLDKNARVSDSTSSSRTSGISYASSTPLSSNGQAAGCIMCDHHRENGPEQCGRSVVIRSEKYQVSNSQKPLLSRGDRFDIEQDSHKRFFTSLQHSSKVSRNTRDRSTAVFRNESLSSAFSGMYYTVQPTDAMYNTGLQHFNSDSRSVANKLSPNDKHLDICNTFWRAGLAFNSYRTGDKLVIFSTLWPNSATLESLIWEAYYKTSLKKSVLELCRLGICCGPFHIVQAMVILNIIGLDTRFESGSSLLHLSCIAKNYEAATYICQHGGDKQITDRQGRTPADVCDSVKILKVMGSHSQGRSHDATEDSQDRSTSSTSGHSETKSAPTLYEKQLMFEMATVSTELDELLLKIQAQSHFLFVPKARSKALEQSKTGLPPTYDFDVNGEFDENGDFLVHLATREGLSQLPLLIPLVRVFNADINLPNRAHYTSLMVAAEVGNHVLLDVLVCVLGAQPNLQQPDTGYTALHLSCLHDHADCVQILLNRGADYNIEDKYKMRPDDLAEKVKGQGCDSCVLIQKYRVERMAKLKEFIEQDQLTKESMRSTDLFVTEPETGFTLIMIASHLNKTKSLRTLLSFEDAPINAQHGQSMKTALSIAAEEGNTEAMMVLLENEANPAIVDLNRLIPIHYAVKNNHVDLVSKLLEHKHCLVGLELASALATTEPMKEVIKSAIVRRQRDLVTPALFECAMTGEAERLYCVLEEGDCVSPVSGFGQWPLYLAVENGLLPVVKLLCECGADLHRKHKSTGNTVLHLSAALGRYEITAYLLEIFSSRWGNDRTDVNRIVHVMNFDGKTPLMLAAEKGWMSLIQLLLRFGSSSSVLNFRGELYTCQEFEGCQSMLEKHRVAHSKAVMDLLKKRDSLTKLQQVFLPRFDHNLRDGNGDTPLMVACTRQNISLVKFLLESSVYVREHHKNFQGSFARSYVSSRTVSDSGRHSPAGNHSSSSSPICCLQTNKVEVEIHRVDFPLDDGFLEKCCLQHSSCVGDDLYASSALPTTSKCVASSDNLFDNKPGNNSLDTNKLVRNRSCHKLGIDFGDRESENGCKCSRCMEKVRTCENCQSATEGLNNMTNVTGLPLHTIVTETGYIPEDKEYEQQIQENISALFTSIHSVNNRGSIFITEIMISHLCAKNLTDGATCFHRLISAGDNLPILTLLLEKDRTAINLQDNAGLAPIHVAAMLCRKKIVAKMTSLTYVDLNVRTLDGRLPEEMTKDKTILQLLKKARDQEPEQSVFSPLFSSLSTSVFGAGSFTRTENTDELNFDQTHQQYMDLKQTLTYENSFLEKNNAMLIGMM